MRSSSAASSRTEIFWLVAASGFAALSWEVVWQIKSALALGVSAWGTALTLAATMGGLSVGSLTMGRRLKKSTTSNPLRLYGALECVIGFAGLFLNSAFRAVERLDTWAYGAFPECASLIHISGIVLVLGVPTFCMGATIPVFGLLARQFRTSIAVLYGLNTLGAAAGALAAAFLLIPQLGVTHAILAIAALNIAVALLTWFLKVRGNAVPEKSSAPRSKPRFGIATEILIVVVTGFATFVLEVAWFRSLTAAFHSTTDAFAIMLASVLIALGLSANLIPLLRQRKVSLGLAMGWAGILILLATPLVERFDIFAPINMNPVFETLDWFLMTLYIIGPPVALLGIAFPWILDEQSESRRWGVVYAFNTFAAIIGSLGAAWVLLPAIGFAHTAWLAGILVAGVGLLTVPRAKRLFVGAAAVAALLIAVTYQSGAGTTRVQGRIGYGSHTPSKILEYYEGPEATISAVEMDNGWRALVIDGFVAATHFGADAQSHSHYMPWMGRLPMLLHPDPRDALVICFGTGQTANAVRNENPQSLDIVDVNPRVFRLAHNFPMNQDVLADPRVQTIVMDGRAYLRRVDKVYDVITLEPMPPNFAGVNALYDREFYQLARKRLGPHGVIAQWLPFQLVAPHYAASIARTFHDEFPNSILWIDPASSTGILVGSVDDGGVLGDAWPGFRRDGIERDMTEQQVRHAVLLDRNGVARYAAHGETITDDNQLLAYGDAIFSARKFDKLSHNNFGFLREIMMNTAK